MNLPAFGSNRVADRRLESVLTHLGVAATLLMEVAWFTPWFRYFNPRARAMGELAVLGSFLAAALIAMLADKALSARQAAGWVRPLYLLDLLLAEVVVLMLVYHPEYPGLSLSAFVERAVGSLWTVLEVIPAELVIILSVLFVFRRGINAAVQDVLAPERLHFRFRLGIVILAVFGLIFRGAEGELMLEVLPIFFAAGLLALSVSRVDRAPAHAGGEPGPMRSAWIGAMLAIILVTVGLSQAMSLLVRSRIAGEFVAILTSALLEALRLVVIFISPIIQVTGVLLGWLIRATANALGGTQGLSGVVQVMESLAQALPAESSQSPLWLQVHARDIAAGATGLILALLTVMVIRGGKRANARRGTQSVEEVEATPGDPEETDRGRGRPDRGAARMRPSLAGLGYLLAGTSIRRIYGRLLSLAKARGRGRSPAETPLEFLADLRDFFPCHLEEVEIITHAYLEVEYGGRADEDAGVGEVRRAWAALHTGRPTESPPTITG